MKIMTKDLTCKHCGNNQPIPLKQIDEGYNWKCEKCYEINAFKSIGVQWNTDKPTP
jgi:phage FluMu protein Com